MCRGELPYQSSPPYESGPEGSPWLRRIPGKKNEDSTSMRGDKDDNGRTIRLFTSEPLPPYPDPTP